MISLRSYNHEIEVLIDNGQYEEAIAHCRHILEKYHKCIETYRNLGKTLLELKKYAEALDIFSRVLSAFPDDFISHVGLSIISENQKDLDLAIWHMEHAFDVQPSNLVVQDELKRLFGQRDGEQPNKIRLTRGALVRMYARGELYQQAITEILSILEQDAKRTDLEVILARMYFLSGDVEQALITCRTIIGKIPYCFEVNQLLHGIFLSKNSPDEAAICKNRLCDIDPYFQFKKSPSDDQVVPENKIMLEKLVYIPTGTVDTKIPSWHPSSEALRSQVGMSENIPTFEESISNKADEKTTDHAKEFSNLIDKENGEKVSLPDWMQEAGWTSSFENDSHDNELANDQLIENSFMDAEKTELPDWLKPGYQENNEIADKNEETTPITEPQASVSDSQGSKNDLASLFSELNEGKMDKEDLNNNENSNAFPPSDWLHQSSNSDENSADNSQPHDIPDWLKNFDTDDPQDKVSDDDLPDWLTELQSDAEPVMPDVSDTQPVFVRKEENNTEESGAFEDLLKDLSNDQSEPEDLNDWKVEDFKDENLVNESSNSDSLHEENQDSDDKIPEWVKSVLLEKDEDQGFESQQISEMVDEKKVVDQLVIKDDDSNSVSQKDADVEAENGVISQQTNDELLDWLRGIKEEKDESGVVPEYPDEVEPEISENRLIDQLGEQTPVVETTENAISDQSHDKKDVMEEINTSLISESSFESNLYVGEDNIELSADEALTEPTLESASIRDIAEIKSIQSESEKADTEQASIADTRLDAKDLIELLLNKEFDKLTESLDLMVKEGQDFDQTMSTLESSLDKHSNDFSLWQAIGDLYARHGKLNNALNAYQIAENLLLRKIS